MKVNLSLGKMDITGYKNINPFFNIDDIIDNSAYEIIVQEEVLKSIKNENITEFINLVYSKLRLGGTITFECIDIYQASVMYLNGSINEENLSELINNSSGFYTCKIIENELKKINLKIARISIHNNIYFTVTGERIV